MTKSNESPTFMGCFTKTSVNYYKKIAMGFCVIVTVCAVIYGVVITGSAILPIITTTALSVPAWGYAIAGVLIAPLIAAYIKCRISYEDQKIKKADEEYVCPED